mmetsp:Transcript_96759/g.273390  ORF Transcript_96759/g.273390 Transcript_96759/m.273390 type:complete len:485 (+) Transcript_96759:16-1470(+)
MLKLWYFVPRRGPTPAAPPLLPMSSADLRRVIERSKPRVEDVRSPDRTDFIRREHGHLSFRAALDAITALDFAADNFLVRMREAIAETTTKPAGDGEDATAPGAAPDATTSVHELFNVLDNLRVFCPSLPVPIAPEAAEAATEVDDAGPTDEVAPGWEEAAAAAKALGAERFKLKEYRDAAEHYSAAIRATPRGDGGLHALYSNRSAARLQLGDAEAALADARRCVALAPEWPKGRFREGCCLRQLGRHEAAVRAFEAGQALEPNNKDWAREVEKSEKLLRAEPPALVRQLVMNMLPELLTAWLRGGCSEGVLQLQIKGALDELGVPKFQLLRDKQAVPQAMVRYAFVGRKDYLTNLAANVQEPPADDSVATTDIEGKPLKIAEVSAFLKGAAEGSAFVHIDIRSPSGKMCALICTLPCAENIRTFVPAVKDPPRPKTSVEAVLKLQRSSGFPKADPRLLGFQNYPGDLNFPVVDAERDSQSAD